MTKKALPKEIFYLAPNGLLAYENNIPNGYEGETEIIFAKYATKDLNLQDKAKIESSFKSYTTRQHWEDFINGMPKGMCLTLKNDNTKVIKVTFAFDKRSEKDVIRIKTEAQECSYIVELAHKFVEISLTNNQ